MRNGCWLNIEHGMDPQCLPRVVVAVLPQPEKPDNDVLWMDPFNTKRPHLLPMQNEKAALTNSVLDMG